MFTGVENLLAARAVTNHILVAHAVPECILLSITSRQVRLGVSTAIVNLIKGAVVQICIPS